MLIGTMVAVGNDGGRGKIPINEVYLKIPTLMLTKDYVVSSTKGTFDPHWI
jgi:hypothetical protein